jgi:hypothetical protein
MTAATEPTRPDFASSTFWLNTGERVIRTAAQTALALGVADKTTALELDWQQAGLAVAVAAGSCLLTCLAGKTVGDGGSPSFVLPAPRVPTQRNGRHEALGGPDAGPPPQAGGLPPYDRDARSDRDAP